MKDLTHIVLNGTKQAVIIIPDDPDKGLKPSHFEHTGYADLKGRGYGDADAGALALSVLQEAHTLSDYIKRSSGANVDVKFESALSSTDLIYIHIGFTKYVRTLESQFKFSGNDDFIIDATNPRNIILIGPTCWAIKFAVNEFLERYMGVCWLIPGPAGEDIPATKDISVPRERIESKPAFFSRLLSGLNGIAPHVWAQNHRMRGHVAFHHGLYKLLPPAVYTKTHPEFYPIIDGKRYLPKDNCIEQWQPCLTNEAGIEEAIKNVCSYFDNNPEVNSYSLGINDSGGFCECPDCNAQKGSHKNFYGLPDLSDYYFCWCNKIVKGVLKKHPDKYFGCIAYSEIAQPPRHIELDDHIVPYMTYDRLQYADPELRNQNLKHVQNWLKAAHTVGWYDYFNGAPYAIPRVYFHHMADFIRLGHEIGIKAFYAEAYPFIGEGPKFYLSLKLLWNPYLDVDSVLNDWYIRMVGSKSASYLAEYYTFWEDLWTKTIPQYSYFRQDLERQVYSRTFDYLNHEQVSYIDAVTVDHIRHARELLESVIKNAGTAIQQQRANMLMRAFQFYELSSLAYLSGKNSLDKLINSKTDAIESLNNGISCFTLLEKRKSLVCDEYSKEPDFCMPVGNNIDRSPENAGNDWGQSSMWQAFNFSQNDTDAAMQILELARKSNNVQVQRQMQFMLASADPTVLPITRNPDFSQGDAATAEHWLFQTRSAGSIKRIADNRGKYCICCQGVEEGTISTHVDISPGFYGAVAKIFYPAKTSPASKVWATIIPLSPEGTPLRRIISEMPSLASPRIGEWDTYGFWGQIPSYIRGEPVASLKLIVHVQGFKPEEKVLIGKAAIFKLNTE